MRCRGSPRARPATTIRQMSFGVPLKHETHPSRCRCRIEPAILAFGAPRRDITRTGEPPSAQAESLERVTRLLAAGSGIASVPMALELDPEQPAGDQPAGRRAARRPGTATRIPWWQAGLDEALDPDAAGSGGRRGRGTAAAPTGVVEPGDPGQDERDEQRPPGDVGPRDAGRGETADAPRRSPAPTSSACRGRGRRSRRRARPPPGAAR